jgi:hypothetical protein
MLGGEILEIGDCAVVTAAEGIVPFDAQVGFGGAGGQVLKRTGVENSAVMALEFDAKVHFRVFIFFIFYKKGKGNYLS